MIILLFFDPHGIEQFENITGLTSLSILYWFENFARLVLTAGMDLVNCLDTTTSTRQIATIYGVIYDGSWHKQAVLSDVKLRAAFDGPTKSGKTFLSLLTAREIIDVLGKANALPGNGKILLIDAEDGRAKYYSNTFKFDHYRIYDFSPESYIDTLKLAAEDDYSIVIVDQISHEWSGQGGILELKGNQEVQSGFNSWTAWRPITPRHEKFVQSIVGYPAHIICTMRSKMDHVQEQEDGKWKVKRVGMEPVQRESTPYEFDIEASITQDHVVTIKTRGDLSRVLGNRTFHPGPDIDHPGEVVEVGRQFARWSLGNIDENQEGMATHDQIKEIKHLGDSLGFDYAEWKKFCNFHKVSSLNSVPVDIYTKMQSTLIKLTEKKEKEKAKSKSQI